MSESEWEVIHADSRTALHLMKENSVDSVVTDPPYDLTSIQKRFGSEDSAPAQFGSDGSFARLSKGFMGKKWDGTGVAFTPVFWKEVFRVLKPGGHLLAFGGTRTYHRMAVAIEDAGFEIRDSIDWIYGSGFPKSHDVSKAIDARAGAEREVIGTGKGRTGETSQPNGGSVLSDDNYQWPGDYNITKAATPEAQQYEGWGTALKPAHEPIVVARKPLSEGSVAANVLRWGTGAINIDGTRIGNESRTYKGSGVSTQRYSDGRAGLTDGRGRDEEYQAEGRWPANVILTHSPDCRKVGTNADEDGTETVEAWECTEGCPVRLLDEQSGVSTSSGGRSGHEAAYGGGYKQEYYGDAKPGLGDTGGASRFFTTLSYDDELDVPFFYCAKASRSERNEGLDDMPKKEHPWVTHRMEAHGGKISEAQQRFVHEPVQNIHPTVKPVALMEWLIRLVTPAGGLVVDPFLGSGSTGVAAVKGGWNFVGIEGELEYVEIANPRIAHEANKPRQLELFSA